MKFLAASKLVKNSKPSQTRTLLVASSAQSENLDVYLQAEFVLRDIDCQVSHIAFNTLEQYLLNTDSNHDFSSILLLPWDFLPSLDWRTGVIPIEPDLEDCRQHISRFTELLKRQNASCCFLNSPIPPIFNNSNQQAEITRIIHQAADAVCDNFLSEDLFYLPGYLENGTPLAGSSCGMVASVIVESLVSLPKITHKVLLTDLDNVMWRGVIGEDGIEEIEYSAQGGGYVHYIYQSYLKRLKNSGVLLAVVSKNDHDLAAKPFLDNNMVLSFDDLVTLQASYHSKSSQIRNIIEHLNLSADAFVFVDDNMLEIEEVSRAIPGITTLLFPQETDQFSMFLENLVSCFDIREVTDEDLKRTSLYKTRMHGLPASTASASDLEDFLLDLSMEMTVSDRSKDNNERALQLINKTNQFNINGQRLNREELNCKLEQGYRLYTAQVADRYGEHGEILVCLLSPENYVETMVMSCRVFQRQIENFFLSWLITEVFPQDQAKLTINFVKTQRNSPVEHFLERNNFISQNSQSELDTDKFLDQNSSVLKLFKLIIE